MDRDSGAYVWESERLCIEDCFSMHKEYVAYA